MDIDLTTLTDDQLDQVSDQVLTERERRLHLARIPEQVAALCEIYCAGGGNHTDLITVIQDLHEP